MAYKLLRPFPCTRRIRNIHANVEIQIITAKMYLFKKRRMYTKILVDLFLFDLSTYNVYRKMVIDY